jgi:NADH dehydrogenase [ubiquinone] 1 alpha subcomplex assembly factor 6
MQFWRESINKTFEGSPPSEPICVLLHHALRELEEGAGTGAQGSIKFWIERLARTRERHMENRPFPSLHELEEYAEKTYSSLMYATLASIPMRSMHLDHLASHIGKACGIIAMLRGIPVLAAPQPPVESPRGSEVGKGKQPVLLLPLDIMAKHNLKEEDVFRQGPNAEGLRDAIFEVATRANAHLITARELLKNLQAGQGPSHEYEHQEEKGHLYEQQEEGEEDIKRDIRRSFGVLLEAVPAQKYLDALEKLDFNPFGVRNTWNLPWHIWMALRNRQV